MPLYLPVKHRVTPRIERISRLIADAEQRAREATRA
jgi:hypothetical protein